MSVTLSVHGIPVVQQAQVDSVRAEVCPGCLPRCHTIDYYNSPALHQQRGIDDEQRSDVTCVVRADTDDICYVLIVKSTKMV